MRESRIGTTVKMAVMVALVSASARAQVNCNVGIEFHPGGGVKACQLNGNHQLYTARGEVVNCVDGGRLEQHAGGRLASCDIARTHRFGDRVCAAPARVEFEADGRLRSCERI